MKWFFFLLLLINIGLFVWVYPQSPLPESETNNKPGVKTLILLKEVGSGELNLRQKAVADKVGEVEPAGKSNKFETSAVEAKSKIVQAPAQDLATNATELVLPPPGPGHDQSVDEGVPQPVAASLDDGGDIFKQKPAEQTVVQVQPGRQCRKVGPLGKRGEADKLSLRLMALGAQADLQMELTDEQEGYWVLIPPQENKEAAIEIVKRLHAAGVSDLWRFTSGSLAHAISLGLFRNESRAEIRRKAIVAKGFDPEVRPRYRQKSSYWLGFAFSGDSPISDESWKAIVRTYPGVEQLTVDCAEIGAQ
jgi:hypothetical protein